MTARLVMHHAVLLRSFGFGALTKVGLLVLSEVPPCETWSKARGVEISGDHQRKGPRVIRNASELWGFAALGLKELAQVSMGNELLLFSLVCIFRLALTGGVAILEHPAEPESEEAASIWRLQIVILLTHLPGVEVLRVLQGHFGAPVPQSPRICSA